MKRKNLLLFILLLTAMPCLNLTAKEHEKNNRITFCIGKIVFSRNGETALVKPGISVQKDDVFRLAGNDMLQITTCMSGTVSVKGPVIFRFTETDLKKDIGRAGSLFSFYRKISKDVRHYCPRTIVTAVRGENEKDNVERNKRLADDFSKAVSLYKESRFDESLAMFSKISSQPGLRRHVMYLAGFYSGEILFNKMQYSAALDEYLKVYKTRNRKFLQKENAHLKAVLSAYYCGNDVVMRKLVVEYRENYGIHSRYFETINRINSE